MLYVLYHGGSPEEYEIVVITVAGSSVRVLVDAL